MDMSVNHIAFQLMLLTHHWIMTKHELVFAVRNLYEMVKRKKMVRCIHLF